MPARIAQPVYYRVFRRYSAGFRPLFQRAKLRYAPSVRLDLEPGDECHGVMAFTGFYELSLTRLVLEEAKRGGLLVDVGANFGYYSLMWAGQGGRCRALALEASPDVFQALSRNIGQNALCHRVDARHMVVSDFEGDSRFQPAPAGQTGWGHVSAEGSIEVPTDTLDHILQDVSDAVILKVDAEGHDFQILCGAKNAFARRMFRQVFWEASREGFSSPAGRQFSELAMASGYSLMPLDPNAQGVTIFRAIRD